MNKKPKEYTTMGKKMFDIISGVVGIIIIVYLSFIILLTSCQEDKVIWYQKEVYQGGKIINIVCHTDDQSYSQHGVYYKYTGKKGFKCD